MLAYWRATVGNEMVMAVTGAAAFPVIKDLVDTIARMNRDWLAASFAPGEKSPGEELS